jgi:hypothetical protein
MRAAWQRPLGLASRHRSHLTLYAVTISAPTVQQGHARAHRVCQKYSTLASNLRLKAPRAGLSLEVYPDSSQLPNQEGEGAPEVTSTMAPRWAHPCDYHRVQHGVRQYTDNQGSQGSKPSLWTSVVALSTMAIYVGWFHILLGIFVAAFWYRWAAVAFAGGRCGPAQGACLPLFLGPTALSADSSSSSSMVLAATK